MDSLCEGSGWLAQREAFVYIPLPSSECWITCVPLSKDKYLKEYFHIVSIMLNGNRSWAIGQKQ